MSSIWNPQLFQKELKFALDVAEKQPEGTVFIIPVKLEEWQVPERLTHLHWVDFFQPNGCEHLSRSLRERSESLGLASTPSFLDDAFQIWTASGLHARDSVVRMLNLNPSGPLCVNVYVLHPAGEMLSCGSCLIPANGSASWSCQNDLIVNTLAQVAPDSIIIKLIASRAMGGLCTPSPVRPDALASGLHAWGKPDADVESLFACTALSEAELTSLQRGRIHPKERNRFWHLQYLPGRPLMVIRERHRRKACRRRPKRDLPAPDRARSTPDGDWCDPVIPAYPASRPDRDRCE